METLLDGLEADLTVVDSELSVTVPATPGVLAAAGVDPTHGDANGNLRDEVSNVPRFDLTQRDSDTDSCSDTVSCGEGPVVCQSRRLRLMWDHTRAEPRDDEGQVDHPTVRAAAHLFHTLARRINLVQVGAPMPGALLRQRWSPLTIPLLWEAAGDSPTCLVVDWLLRTSGHVVDPVQLHENNVTVSQAVTLGWSSLRGVLRGWGVCSREDLTVWLRERGYPGAQPGNHIIASAQEHLFHRASGVDARVSLLEAAFVTIHCFAHGKTGARKWAYSHRERAEHVEQPHSGENRRS